VRRVLRDVGEGLMLREARPEDAGRPGLEGAWARELLTGTHPGARSGRGFVVEDTGTGTIASAVLCLSHTWSYGGIRFPICQVAIVGTGPQYRRRGLVRAQFEAVHAWSARRGHLAQVISGIPYFYRQFGYEYAMEAEEGRAGHKSQAPALHGKESFRLRPAREADLPLIARAYTHGMRRYAVALLRGRAEWRYELGGWSGKSGGKVCLEVIERAAREPVGFLRRDAERHHGYLGALIYELVPGVSWLAVTPSVVRHLCQTGEGLAAKNGGGFEGFTFWLGADHPAYQVARDSLPVRHPPYAHYLRVPGLPAFLRHIAPALEARLADSVAVGYSGELRLSFCRSGLRLVFEHGKLATVDDATSDGASASFPDLTFLQLLFGGRSLEELAYAYPDCRAHNGEARLLLDILFPKCAPGVWHLA
jgi:hypothetical protein